MEASCKEKLFFVMAAQASYICFSFYQALDIFNKKISVASKIFFY